MLIKSCKHKPSKVLGKIQNFAAYSLEYFLKHPLWKGHRLEPFLRFAKLQLFFARGGKQINLKWINDLILPIKKGDTGLTGNYYLGLHEFTDMAFMLHLLRREDTFIDIGANLGSYTMLASGIAEAKSLAFEPNPSTYERLRENIRINFLNRNAETRQIALSSPKNCDQYQTVRFSADKGAMNSIVDDSYLGSTNWVKVSTLDHETANLSPTLIKIDVEGFEDEVLSGSANTLQQKSLLAVIIEGQTENVNDYFRKNGFIDVDYNPLARELRQHSQKSSNRIWIKEIHIDKVSSRLRKCERFTVYDRTF